MHVAVTGATGTIGTGVLAALRRDPEIDRVTAIARRLPAEPVGGPKVRWVGADVVSGDLEAAFAGADAVLHLAWALNPSEGRDNMRRINLDGSRRVFAAALAQGVGTIVQASSLAAYSPGPKDRLVDENWPTDGVRGSGYSEDKVAVERLLDDVEAADRDLRVVRLRPVLVVRRGVAEHLRREFVGGWFPRWIVQPEKLPLLVRHPRLRSQLVHADDVAEAIRLALHADVRGALNLAADPVIDAQSLAGRTGARTVPLPALPPLRTAHAVAHLVGLVRGEPGWTDLTLNSPLLDASRARRELGWSPRHDALDALFETVEGLRDGATDVTPPLAPDGSI
jgi:nucleoside-diphosphate-sugar epimerase